MGCRPTSRTGGRGVDRGRRPAAGRTHRDDRSGRARAVLVAYDDDHAVAIANQVPYALAAAVTSGSVERATVVADRLRAAAVAITDGLPHGSDAPYGTYCGGTGHNGGGAALNDFLAAKVLAVPAWTTSHVDLMILWTCGGTAPLPARSVFHCDRVGVDQRVFVAGSAALVRGAVPDCAPPLQPVDRGRVVAPTPSRGTGRVG
jgi:hypothetical protein